MHSSWERSVRGEKQGKHPKNPSFSTILLDEIFNSIDGTEQNLKEIKHFRNQSIRKPINDADYVKAKTTSYRKEAEEMASLKRACMMEKLMEKQINAKVSSTRKISSPPELDSIRTFSDFVQTFYSTSSSSSSDSSSGGHSSSDAELFYNSSSRKPGTVVTSCFLSKSSSKPIKSTTNIPRPRGSNHRDSSNYKQSECYMFDDYYSPSQEMNGNGNEDNVMKSKSRALSIYNNFKKVRQPISPGARLTNFITSLFTSGNAKKSRGEEGKYERKGKPIKPSSTTASTCSSASSFSRSCLSKSVPNSRGKLDDFGARKTVHFYPVSVIVDEDSRPCGHKSIYNEDDEDSRPCGHKSIYNEDNEEFDGFKRRPRSYQSSEALKSHVLERKKKVAQEDALDVFLKGWKDQEKENDIAEGGIFGDFDDEEVDRISNSSSDLFEIDHLGVFGNNRFCEELPVYETTHLDRNRAIASNLRF